MCGINGLWNLSAPDIEKPVFDRFTDSLAHRGPNGRGTYWDESSRLWLGHRRLSILDLSQAASQPMSYAKKRYWLTFNGEIYNFLELREELKSQGAQFVTDSDSEVLLAAYHLWKQECQYKFNGMWAFAIWDQEKKELFLSRDRFGVKPLYFLFHEGRFCFASEMKAFLELPFFSLSFDESLVAAALADSNSVEMREECFLRPIRRLLPGHSLLVTQRGAIDLRRWWSTLDHVKPAPSSRKERTELFQTLLTSACRLRMRSDVPLGSAVSGGLDSSSILSLLSEMRRSGENQERIHRDWHRAFVALFPGTSQDEHRFAQEIVEWSQAPAVFCPIEPEQLVSHLDQVLLSVEEIFDAPLGPWMLYREYKKQGIVISIDGHGADELLGGYGHHVETALSAALFPLPHLSRYRDVVDIQKHLYPPNSPFTPKSVGTLFKNELQRHLQAHPHLRQLLKRLFSKNRMKQWLRIPYSLPSVRSESSHLDPLNLQLYQDFHERTLPVILRNFDRCSMAHGVEIRSPFLDWRLVTLGFSLPPEDKIGGGFTKRILRDVMQGKLPETIRTRRAKIGFASPITEWMGTSLKPFVLDSLRSTSFLQSSIWDGPQIASFVESCYEKGDLSGFRSCWEFVQAHRLMQLYRKKRGYSSFENTAQKTHLSL